MFKWFKIFIRSKKSNKREWLEDPIYEHNPTRVRTLERSEFQDEAQDILTRSPERKVYDEKTFEKAQEALHHPNKMANQHSANPGHE